MYASDYRRIARENLTGNWGVSVLTAFVAALLGGLLTGSGFSLDLEVDSEWAQFLPDFALRFLTTYLSAASILGIVQFVLGGVVQLGYSRFLLKQYDKSDFELKDLFSHFDHFGEGFLQKLLRGLYTFLWSLLFIIPGIIKSLSYSMTPFIMAEHPELTPSEAISYSQELMDGHKGDLFFLDLTFIGWDLLNALTLGIGGLFLNPYKNAAHAAFYRDLCPKGTPEEPKTTAEF